MKTQTTKTYQIGRPKPVSVRPNGRFTVPLRIPRGIEALSSKNGNNVTKASMSNCGIIRRVDEERFLKLSQPYS